MTNREIKISVLDDMQTDYWKMFGIFLGPAITLSLINSILLKLNVLSIGQVLVVAVSAVGMYFSLGTLWLYIKILSKQTPLNKVKVLPAILYGISNIATKDRSLGRNMFYGWLYNLGMLIIFWVIFAIGFSVSLFNLFISSNFVHILNQLQTISMEEVVYFAQLPHINWLIVVVSWVLSLLFYYWLYIPTKVVNILIYYRPNLKPWERLKLAFTVIRHHRFNFFTFQLSFIGWLLLSVLSLGLVGVFYLGPYYGGSECRKIIGYIKQSEKLNN